jgi:murein DD-endopeptidase MepM/ murein hydrolase activator NlpD
MSGSARILSGGLIMIFGYLPVLVDIFSFSEKKEKNLENSLFALRTISEKNAFFNLYESRQANEKSLIAELLQNTSPSSVFAPKTPFGFIAQTDEKISSPKENISPIKIISAGEFTGHRFVKNTIDSSFYADARRSGVPAAVVDAVVFNLSSRIDFRHSLKKGDTFEIIYSPNNVMQYAAIRTKNHQTAVYRFVHGKNSAYYFENGVKVSRGGRGTFGPPLKTGLRVSSGFGSRIHPLKGVYQRHTGVDFIAAHGTPVYAIFDGVVTRASRYYGYGNCVDIRHASAYSSRYGHLSRCVVRSGTRVKKGQLIGYSGSTGTSTGPHLHLELAKNNKVINPLSVKMIPNEAFSVPHVGNFNALKRQINKIVNDK